MPTPINAASLNEEQLYNLLIDPATTEDVLSAVIKEVMENRFSSYSPTQQTSFSDIINDLAIKNVSAAFPYFNSHLNLNSPYYSDWFAADTTFKMSGWPRPVQEMVAKDIAKKIGAKPKDIIEHNDDGSIKGLKLESPLRDDLHLKLIELYRIDTDRGLPPEAAEGLSFSTKVKDGLMTPVKGWQTTWDKARKAITTAKTPEEMGEEFCKQIMLLPLNFANNWMSAFDAWAVKAFKARQAEKARAAASGGSPSPAGGSTPSGSGTPSSGKPDIDDSVLEAINERAKMEKIQTFKHEYLNTLYKHALKHHDKASQDLALQLEAAWKKDYKDEADFEAQNPGLYKKMWKNLEKTLLKQPENKDLLAAFMASEFAPETFKDQIKKQVEQKAIENTANKFRTAASTLASKESKGFAPKKEASKTEEDFTLHQTRAGKLYGMTLDPKTESITHFYKDPATRLTSSVTYFPNEGRAFVIQQDKPGKARKALIEGLNGDNPTINGKFLLDAPREAWTAAFNQHAAILASAKAKGFKSLGAALSVKTDAALFKEAVLQTR